MLEMCQDLSSIEALPSPRIINTHVRQKYLPLDKLNKASKRNTTIPGPNVIDEIEGNLPDITANGSLHEFLCDLHSTYGKIVSFWFGPQFCVSIASPELFKEQANIFDRPKQLFEQFEPLLTPHCIHYANGADGRKRLNAYAKSYNHEAIRGYFDILVQHSQKTKQKWIDMAKDEHIALGDNMFAYSIQVMLAASFGKYFENEKEVLQFKKAYDIVWSEMESRICDSDIPDSNREERFEKNKKVIEDMVLNAAALAKNTPREEGEPPKFVDVIHELDISQQTVVADMINVTIGGVHTSGLLATWAIYYMASNPEIQEKVYNELTDILGEETIVFEAVNQLRYLRQVLDESLRCSTLAPFAARVQELDTELGGHKVPTGTPVVHALGVVLQDETLWPDPETFDPERFSEENRKQIPSFAFEPFGFAGKRKCVGYRLSYYEVTVLLSELLRKFKVELIEGQSVQKVYGVVTKPMDEIWISLKQRD